MTVSSSKDNREAVRSLPDSQEDIFPCSFSLIYGKDSQMQDTEPSRRDQTWPRKSLYGLGCKESSQESQAHKTSVLEGLYVGPNPLFYKERN